MKRKLNKYFVISLIAVVVSLLLTSVAWAGWARSSHWEVNIEPNEICTDGIIFGFADAREINNDESYEFFFYDDVISDTIVGYVNILKDQVPQIPTDPKPDDYCNPDNFDDPAKGTGELIQYCGGPFTVSWDEELQPGTEIELSIRVGNNFLTNAEEPPDGKSIGVVSDCSPPTPPVVDIVEIEPGSTNTVVTEALVFQAAAYVPDSNGASTPNGTSISNITHRIFDANDMQVHQRKENNRYYCGFGDSGPDTTCNQWVFADHGYQWPGGGGVIKNGAHTLQAIAEGNNGSSSTTEIAIIIQLPIFGNWTQIGPNSTANTVIDALVGQIESYLGAHVDGKDVDKVDISLIGPGGPIRTKTENNQPYCLFGGGNPCPIWNFADHDYEWPNGQSIQNGTHTLKAEITAEDGRKEMFEISFQIVNPAIEDPMVPVYLPIIIK